MRNILYIIILSAYSLIGQSNLNGGIVDPSQKEAVRLQVPPITDNSHHNPTYQSKGGTKSKKSKETPTITAEQVAEELAHPERYATDNFSQGKAQTYDASIMEKYRDSPCFEKAGINPYMSELQIQSVLSSCERDYYTGLAIKIGSIVLILGGIFLLVRFSMKK